MRAGTTRVELHCWFLVLPLHCALLLYLSEVGFNVWQREGLVWGLGEQL